MTTRVEISKADPVGSSALLTLDTSADAVDVAPTGSWSVVAKAGAGSVVRVMALGENVLVRKKNTGAGRLVSDGTDRDFSLKEGGEVEIKTP